MNQRIVISLVILLLTACGALPHRKVEVPSKPASVEAQAVKPPTDGAYLAGDGPGVNVPANLDAIPDAVPRDEPLHKYANRPYKALGKTYSPLSTTDEFNQHGIASWYGKKFHGQPTSSGEIYDMYAMTAAHPTLPIPSYARVTNLGNQKSVVVRINDRGPFLHERVIDLSYVAAHKLDIINNGSAEVEVQSLSPDATSTPNAASEPVQTQTLEITPPPVVEVVPVAMPPTETSDNKIYLQLGAFKTQEAADAYLTKMRSELSDTGKEFRLTTKDGLVRVQMGTYENVSVAKNSAASLEGKLGFKPMVSLP